MCAADSIEANVENAEAHVQSGTQQLSRAADYQVNHDKRIICYLNWNNVNKEKWLNYRDSNSGNYSYSAQRLQPSCFRALIVITGRNKIKSFWRKMKAKSVMWSPNRNNTGASVNIHRHHQPTPITGNTLSQLSEFLLIKVLGKYWWKGGQCVCVSLCVIHWWTGSPVNHRWPCTGQPAQVTCYLLVTCAESISVFDPVTDGTDSSVISIICDSCVSCESLCQ